LRTCKKDSQPKPVKRQKDSIIYNSKITVSNIPDKAYEYVVNPRYILDSLLSVIHVNARLAARPSADTTFSQPDTKALS